MLIPFFAVSWLAGCGGGGGADARTTAGSAPNGSPAPTAPSAFVLESVQVAPYAIWADEIATRSVTVSARTNGSAGLRLELSYFDGLDGATGAHVTRPMYDDGSHGDRVAGDGEWTLSLVMALAEPPTLRRYDGLVDAVPITIAAIGSSGQSVPPSNAIDASVDLGLVSRGMAEHFTLRELDTGLNATEYLVNIVDPVFDAGRIAAVTERLYEAYSSDPFDFVVMFSAASTGDGVPRSMGVRNGVEGIAIANYDHSAAYGSGGRLQQVVYQNARVLGIEINHEIGHRWGAFLDDPVLDLSLPNGFHWGPSTHVGQMGNGPYLEADGAGRYLVTNAHGSEQFAANPFSMLELYLMGLAGEDEVGPLRFVTDPAVDVRFGEYLPETATREVTIDDIVATYGARNPTWLASQNAFTAAFVVVSAAPLGDAERTFSSTIARYAAGTSTGGMRSGGLFDVIDPPSFAAATSFRATLESRLP